MTDIEPVTTSAMSAAQTEAWHALFDVHERIPNGWALIGGQLVTCTASIEAPTRRAHRRIRRK